MMLEIMSNKPFSPLLSSRESLARTDFLQNTPGPNNSLFVSGLCLQVLSTPPTLGRELTQHSAPANQHISLSTLTRA